jgi:hypothetical protein
MSTKYQILLRILDAIRSEAAGTKWVKKYAVDDTGPEAIAAARARAYVHLYLKVMFGIIDFKDREPYVTDGGYDGGIDGFYIDRDAKRIYLLQSKFRQTESNFEQKSIDHSELLSMDIERITSGETLDEAGNAYNGKILGLIRMISELPDVARYNYCISIIANCNISPSDVRRLTGGFNAEIFDFSKAYDKLVFPILNGTYFRASDITIHLDLANKSAGAKTNYSVTTPCYDCEITVLFVPALEIAKVMDRYRNSILEHNPRSYLDLDGQTVNAAIKETLLRPDSNEFALMNNGLTILSDETNINERIGQHNKAQVRLLNPQIINGGQTAYTLSRIFNEDKDRAEENFSGKEVLVKVITLTSKTPGNADDTERQRLIDEISAATNRQTAVITTDRFANASIHIELQKVLFSRYGFLYERKRGEFSDGVFSSYIDRTEILDRTLFIRLLLTIYGRIGKAVRRKAFAVHNLTDSELLDVKALDRFALGYELFRGFAPRNTNSPKKYRDALAKVYIGVSMVIDAHLPKDDILDRVETAWGDLIKSVAHRRPRYNATFVDRDSGDPRKAFSPDKWMNSADFQKDLIAYVESLVAPAPKLETTEEPDLTKAVAH